MDKQEYRIFDQASKAGTMPDGENPIFILSMTSNSLLVKISKGELDMSALAKHELENRGLREDGTEKNFS